MPTWVPVAGIWVAGTLLTVSIVVHVAWRIHFWRRER